MTGKNNRPTRILYIADSTSVHTQRWLRYFADRGYDIYLITIGRKRQILPYVHHVINFDQFYYDSPSFITTLFKTRRLIRSIRPDILHAHFVHQYGWLGAFSGFHPFVLTPWGTDILHLPFASRLKIGKWLTEYTLKRADFITVTSHYLKKAAVLLGSSPEKIDVIFWGVDTSKFRPDVDSDSLRGHLNIKPGAPVVFSNRGYSDVYNLNIIISAMARVLVSYPDTVLIMQNAGGIVGGEADVKRKAMFQGIGHAVRFLPQFEHSEMPALYALSDIFVSVPSWDASSVALKEAMASYCTPVISDVEGPKEWVRHHENGIVVPIGDPEALATAICALLNDSGKREQYNRINREMIARKGDHGRQMKKVEDLYHRLLAENGLSRRR